VRCKRAVIFWSRGGEFTYLFLAQKRQDIRRGHKRRIVKNLYGGGGLSSTRHYFYSSGWQVIEERLGTTRTSDRQFVWGLRYIDDIVLRDRDPNGIGTLTERFFGLQDPNWNVTALADTSGAIQERYGFDAYGVGSVLTPSFALRLGTLFDWETMYGGYRLDRECGLYQVRYRNLHTLVGNWITRDFQKDFNGQSLYEYVYSMPLGFVDATGLQGGRNNLTWSIFEGKFWLQLLFGNYPVAPGDCTLITFRAGGAINLFDIAPISGPFFPAFLAIEYLLKRLGGRADLQFYGYAEFDICLNRHCELCAKTCEVGIGARLNILFPTLGVQQAIALSAWGALEGGFDLCKGDLVLYFKGAVSWQLNLGLGIRFGRAYSIGSFEIFRGHVG